MLLCGWSCETDRGASRAHAVSAGDSLRVVVAADAPADLVIGGERYGYYCDLLRAYCDSTGVVLSLVRDAGGSGAEASLRTVPSVRRRRKYMTLGATHYVVLAAAGEQPVTSMHDLAQRIGDGRVWLAAGFQHTRSYDQLRDLLPATELCVAADGAEPFGDLLTGAVDYLICEQGEAAMADALLGGMVTIHAFPEEVRIGLGYGPEGRPAWASDLRAWLAEWRKTDDARRLRARYAGDGFAACVADIVPPCRVVGGISVWDELFRRVGAREAMDWRLLAAIAYHESHFRAGVRSGAGAVGMMQIMPVTARHLGIGASQLFDPETNVSAAARLLEEIEAQLALADSMDAEEKLRIVLAAYNSGVGTVRNARRLAEAEGSDADLWETVADYLALMGDRTYRNDSIPYRRFRGSSETLAFVEDVAERYAIYCSNVAPAPDVPPSGPDDSPAADAAD